ncbi:MAG: hypothetical protein PHE27_04065 [Alphaproteobacteria bacterium]|nr:hypothetical protein [Alphaproteobacteria bacterium]
MIAALLDETQRQAKEVPSKDLLAARKFFFRQAIACGADDPVQLASEVAPLNVEQLKIATRALPDKKAVGYSGEVVSLSSQQRKLFADAALERRHVSYFDTVLGKGRLDKVYSFKAKADAAGKGKIDRFIVQWNEQAKIEHAKANAPGQPRSKQHITRQKIRRNPDKPAYLQVYEPERRADGSFCWEPEETAWKDGPKLGRFLQKQKEWALFEVFHQETDYAERGEGSEKVRNYVTEEFETGALLAFADQFPINCDEIDPENLEIVLSADPQKLGEVSTGQRWHSCMAVDSSNFRFVLGDILAGSMVAYLVFRGDVEARYPLMRMLVKPFLAAGNSDDDVPVPFPVYGGGGEGNKVTREAFSTRMIGLLSEAYAGKDGEYYLHPRLYADGQTTILNLSKEWDLENLEKAIVKFQDSALQESFVEYVNSKKKTHSLIREPNDDPEGDVRWRTKEISRLFDRNNDETGLPRLYFRSAMKSVMSALPLPEQILRAMDCQVLVERQQAFDALRSGDLPKWNEITAAWPHEDRFRVALWGLTIPVTSEKVRQATAQAFSNEMLLRPKGILPYTAVNDCGTAAVVREDIVSLCPELAKRMEEAAFAKNAGLAQDTARRLAMDALKQAPSLMNVETLKRIKNHPTYFGSERKFITDYLCAFRIAVQKGPEHLNAELLENIFDLTQSGNIDQREVAQSMLHEAIKVRADLVTGDFAERLAKLALDDGFPRMSVGFRSIYFSDEQMRETISFEFLREKLEGDFLSRPHFFEHVERDLVCLREECRRPVRAEPEFHFSIR